MPSEKAIEIKKLRAKLAAAKAKGLRAHARIESARLAAIRADHEVEQIEMAIEALGGTVSR